MDYFDKVSILLTFFCISLLYVFRHVFFSKIFLILNTYLIKINIFFIYINISIKIIIKYKYSLSYY